MAKIAPFPLSREADTLLARRAAPRLSDLVDDLTPIQHAGDLPELFAGLARAAVRTMHADACSVSLLDPQRDVLRDVAACVVPPATFNSMVEEHALADLPLTKQILETGEGTEVSVSDPDADENERAFLQRLGFGQVLLVPFSLEGRPFGLVEVYRLNERSFRSDDAQHVSVLCSFALNAYGRIKLAEQVEAQYSDTLAALTSALEAKDPYTRLHTHRMRDLAVGLGAALQVSGDAKRALALGALLHDVGKIGISDGILLKPGPLTTAEWKIMRAHPVIGERMLQSIDFLRPALPIIRQHHERWDGKGYPDQLKGEEIPLGARVVGVCDAFDAMTSDRPYRRALSVEVACERLLAAAGTQFDPECAALLVDIISKMGEENLEERFVRYASSN